MPKVSVLLPTYNGAHRISGAINSVQGQSFKDWELLVVDDGSTDETASVVSVFVKNDPRVRYFKNEKNSGIQRTLNRGLREARGVYIARIDDDDTWSDPQKLAKQCAFLDSHPDYGLLGTGVIVTDEAGKEQFRFLGPRDDSAIRAKILYRNCFMHSSVMFRKTLADRFGGYSEAPETLHIEDYDLWLKMGTSAKFANLPFYGVSYTLRKSSLSGVNKVRQFGEQRNLIKKYRRNYPNYFSSRVKSEFRYWAYRLFGTILPKSLKQRLLHVYKRA